MHHAPETSFPPLPDLPPNPSVDVVIPMHNSAAFIGRALRSAIAQTRAPRRIIVVDDGSRDDSARIVEKLATTSPVPVKLLRQRRRGPAAARNRGLRASDADLIGFLDADDEWLPEKIDRQTRCFAHPDFANLSLVYCRMRYYDDDTKLDVSQRFEPFVRDGVRGDVYDTLRTGCWITGSASAALVRRDALSAVGGWNRKLRFGEDWDLWLRLARRYSFDYIDAPLGILHVHGNSAQNRPAYIVPWKLRFLVEWGARLDPQAIDNLGWSLRAYLGTEGFHPWLLSRLTRLRLSKEIRLRLFPAHEGNPMRYRTEKLKAR